MNLAGKTAFVTGGNKGIGAHIATALADRGATVFATGRDPEALAVISKHPKIIGMEMDMADPATVQRVIAEAGDIDIMIANAGVVHATPPHNVSLPHWDEMMEVNARGVMLCLHETVPKMIERGWGRAVVIASMAGLGVFPNLVGYCASKAAAVSAGKSYALMCQEAGEGKSVTTNIICPGYVKTEMVERAIDRNAALQSIPKDEAEAQLAAANGIKRLIELEEVTEPTLFFCSEGASAVNGVRMELGNFI